MAVEYKTTKLMVEIDKVRPNRWNPNVMDKVTFGKQKKSIEEMGFLGSILVRDHEIEGYYEILDGEHRWKALKEAGATEVPVETVGKISDQDAQLLTILINNLRGKDDVFKRAKILEALNESQLSLLPLTKEEIEHEKQFVKFDFGQYDTDIEDIPERDYSKLVVLNLNEDEGKVWDAVKSHMMEKGLISEKNKKKQDIQMTMKLLQNWMGFMVGSTESQTEYELEV